jgi:hypothetical protein
MEGKPTILKPNQFIIQLDKPGSKFIAFGGSLQVINPHDNDEYIHDDLALSIIRHIISTVSENHPSKGKNTEG